MNPRTALLTLLPCIAFAPTAVKAQGVEAGVLEPSALYAFQSPATPGNTVLIMTMSQRDGSLENPNFPGNGVFQFRIDNNGDAVADVVFSITFGLQPKGTTLQPVTLTDGAGNILARGYTHQDIPVPSLGAKLHCAAFDDPYFIDKAGLDNGFNFTGTDGNAGRDARGIVLEIPSARLTAGGSNIGVYAKTFDLENPRSRFGRPFIPEIIDDPLKDQFLVSEPADDSDYSAAFQQALIGLGNEPAYASALASVFLPDFLTFDTSSSAGFLNGRRLQDDAVDASLGLFSGNAVTTDFVSANDVPFPGNFPYLAPPHAASPAPPVVVSTLADDGPGSLRATLAAVPPGAFIIFDPSLKGEAITLTSGEIVLTKEVTIDASSLGQGVNITTNSTSRAFNVSSTGIVTLRRLSIFQCVSAGNGGGVLNEGSLSMDQCTVFSCNSAGGGGAIANTGTILGMNNCSVAFNSAGFAGGILSRSAGISLTHVTITQNQGSGGTGGIVVESGGTALFDSSVISGNIANIAEADIGGAGTTLVSMGGNFFGSNSSIYAAALPPGTPNANGDHVGTTAAKLDAMLDVEFVSNDSTPAPIPKPGSPVIDIGRTVSLISTDQRGQPRSFGGRPDSGAAEYQGEAREFDLIFKADTDGDGVNDGVEYATGTNTNAIDLTSPRHFRVSRSPSGKPLVTFGYDPAYAAQLIITLLRSQTIGSGETVILSNEFTPFAPSSPISFEDTSAPPGKAFYRLAIRRRP